MIEQDSKEFTRTKLFIIMIFISWNILDHCDHEQNTNRPKLAMLKCDSKQTTIITHYTVYEVMYSINK